MCKQGNESNKKIKGRKQHLVVDILGIPLAVVVHKANIHDSAGAAQVLPKRWIVERSFAWLENFRRLTIDYEFYSESSVVMIQLAFCFLILNKISH